MNECIDVLQRKLTEYLISREKSIAQYNKQEISIELHHLHLTNLNRKIEKFNDAIKILNEFNI